MAEVLGVELFGPARRPQPDDYKVPKIRARQFRAEASAQPGPQVRDTDIRSQGMPAGPFSLFTLFLGPSSFF